MFAIKFLAYTGIRKGELLQMKWSDINFKERTYQIPKSKDVHIVFLPAQAILILEEIKLFKNLGNDFKPFPLGRNTMTKHVKEFVIKKNLSISLFHMILEELGEHYHQKLVLILI